MPKHDPKLDALFQALSDPTRRAILSRLMAGPASVSELAGPIDMALPSVMNHISKLQAGGLIETEKQGRTRICRAAPSGLTLARDWLEQQRAIWEAQLDRLEDLLDTLQEDPDR